MKAGIYDPYLDTLGGGERYCLTLAETLLDKNWEVDLFWPEGSSLKEPLTKKFSLDIKGVNFLPYSPRTKNLFKRMKVESGYDLLFYVSDGSVPLMFGKKNALHFQVPFLRNKRTLKNTLKFKIINKVVCNSKFTQKVVDSSFGIKSSVIYPPVDTSRLIPLKKEKVILSVGRFSQLLQSKRQDVLIESFKKISGALENWKLVLAGGSEIGASEFVKKLKKQSEGYPIEILENVAFKELVGLYGIAKVFWSASGYDIDESINPEKVEHFGISVVESMAAGCIPVVVGKGGHPEIVKDGESGFLWGDKGDLEKITLKLVEDDKLMTKVSKNAILRSKEFSKEVFGSSLYYLLSEESRNSK